MGDEGSVVMLNPVGLTSGASALVVASFAAYLLLRRSASTASRLLGFLLASAALNMFCMAANHVVYARTGVFGSGVNASLAFVCLFVALFAYHFPRNDRPREAKVVAVVLVVLAAVALGRLVAMQVVGEAGYSAVRPGGFLYATEERWDRLLWAHGGTYTLVFSLTSYAWALSVQVRKCIAYERAAGGGFVRAFVAPRSPDASACRDFSMLIVGMVLIPVLDIAGVVYGTPRAVLNLLLSCTVVWVYVNHSQEPTRLRFKLVAVPFALVVAVLVLVGATAVENGVAELERVRREAADAVRARVAAMAARAPPGEPVVLTAEDVPASVKFVVTRPVEGWFAESFRTVFGRDGFDAADLVESDRADRERMLATYAWRERRADSSLSMDAARARILERWSEGADPPWSRFDGEFVYGMWLPGDRRYRADPFEHGGRLYQVGTAERDWWLAVHALTLPWALAVLACGGVIVLGLPFLFRASIVAPIESLLGGVKDVHDGDLTRAVRVRSNDEFGELATSFNQMVTAVRGARDVLERMNTAAFRFVPRAFLRELGHESILDPELGDQRQADMTVLFADVRGFTTLTERMPSAELFGFVNSLLRELGPVIRRHGGFVDKYIGDSVMALFPGAPDAAVSAAVEVRRILAAYNAERATRGEPEVRIGVGIHTGPLMLGIIGEEQRLEVTVLSDVVNVASRLEGLTKRYDATIVISEATRAGLEDPDRHALRFVERVRVAGKSEAVGVFEVFQGDDPATADAKRDSAAELARGIDAYASGVLDEALSSFCRALERAPEDPFAGRYLERTTKLIEEGLPDDWDGTTSLHTK